MTIYNLSSSNSSLVQGSFLNSSNVNSMVLQKNIERAFSYINQFGKISYDPSQASAKELDDAAFKLGQIHALLNRYLNASAQLNSKDELIAQTAYRIIDSFLHEFNQMKSKIEDYLKANSAQSKNYKAFVFFTSSSFELFKTSPLFILKLVYFLSSSKINSPIDLNFLDHKLKQLTALVTHKVCFFQDSEDQLHKFDFLNLDAKESIRLQFETILNGLNGLGGISCIFAPLGEFLNQMIYAKGDNSMPTLKLLEFSQAFNDLQDNWKKAEKLNLKDSSLDLNQTLLFMKKFNVSYQNFISLICSPSFTSHFD